MKCPTCQKPVPDSAPYYPFCSDRCKLIDLGNWASEKYIISTPIRTSEDRADSEVKDDEASE